MASMFLANFCFGPPSPMLSSVMWKFTAGTGGISLVVIRYFSSLVSLRGIFLPIVFFHLATFNCHMNITAISAYSHCGSLY